MPLGPPGVGGPPSPALPVYRVGVDLTAVADVEEALARQGDRYLRRLFTEHEVASCQGPNGVRADSLAGRFAAKEAAVKVLRPSGSRPEWRDIEVCRRANGACDLVLHGGAAQLARSQGIDQVSVSLSHEAGLAVAVVVGWGWQPGSSPSAVGVPRRSS